MNTEFNSIANPAAQRVQDFIEGIDRTFHENTGYGYKADELKATALEKINAFIDEQAPDLHLGQQRVDILKARIAELADQDNKPTEGEQLFNIYDVEDAVIEMTKSLNQGDIAASSVQEAIDILSQDEGPFNAEMILPLSRMIDHVTEVENKAQEPAPTQEPGFKALAMV